MWSHIRIYPLEYGELPSGYKIEDNKLCSLESVAKSPDGRGEGLMTPLTSITNLVRAVTDWYSLFLLSSVTFLLGSLGGSNSLAFTAYSC